MERQDDGQSRLWRVEVDGTGKRPLSDAEPALVLKAVSPDGRWLSVTRSARTPREAWLYPADGDGTPRELWKKWDLEWAPGNRGFLLSSSGMVSLAWMLPNPSGAVLPPALGDVPTQDTLARAGGRKVLSADFFVNPSPMPDPFSVVYSRVDNHSNLYRLSLPN